MCGLVGVMSSSLGIGEIEIAQELMVISTLRGRDGAGVAILNKNDEIKTLRTIATGAHLAYGEKFTAATAKENKLKLILGHCRWPTKGMADNIAFVHPHSVDHILGVHNGTMTRIGNNWPGDKESDSALLFKSIADKGIEETIENSSGAYALIWIDKKEQTISFLRNDQRPLWVAHPAHDSQTLYWASEKSFLEFVLPRHYKSTPVYESLKADTLKTYSLDFKTGKDIVPIFEKEIKAKKLWPIQNYVYGGYQRDKWHQTSSYRPSQTATYGDKDEWFTCETRDGHYLPKTGLMRLLEFEGCAWCSGTVEYEDYQQKKIKWIGATTFLCEECATDPSISQYM